MLAKRCHLTIGPAAGRTFFAGIIAPRRFKIPAAGNFAGNTDTRVQCAGVEFGQAPFAKSASIIEWRGPQIKSARPWMTAKRLDTSVRLGGRDLSRAKVATRLEKQKGSAA